jgi:protein-L-isoaspartate(D-aspartate) O-methyltransferase
MRIYFFAILCLVALPPRLFADGSMNNFEQQRQQMVSGQISARGVRDPAVLAAMSVVPRHRFVPSEYQAMAYDDRPLPIGHGQTISQPYIVARMTELLALTKGVRVLEVGTGSGYQAAVLAELGAKVFSIEIIEPLGVEAARVLSALGYGDVQVKIGDGYQGWPEHAPFDGIIVTCAPSHIPEPLKEQLTEGGRMVIPVESKGGLQKLVLLRKVKGQIIEEKIFDVLFVPMTDNQGKRY